MSDTMWFRKEPGQAPVNQEESAVLVGDCTGGWVRLPPELGGSRVQVKSACWAVCPKCLGVQPVRHLSLRNGMFVAECHDCGFVWYKERKQP